MMSVLSLAVLAQTETTRTIHGAVVDKNGNPLPGAVVSAEGGADTSIAESDGTFSMEVPVWLKKVSASYGGYVKRTLKTNFDKEMIFKMRKLAPTPGGYFINVVGGAVIPWQTEDTKAYFGIRGGHLSNWGWYAEIGYDTLGKGIQATAGGIRRIYGPAFFYLGIGYGKVSEYGDKFTGYDDEGHSIYEWGPRRNNAMAFDGGFMFKIGKHFDLSFGLTFTTDFYAELDYVDFTPKISLGYVF